MCEDCDKATAQAKALALDIVTMLNDAGVDPGVGMYALGIVMASTLAAARASDEDIKKMMNAILTDTRKVRDRAGATAH